MTASNYSRLRTLLLCLGILLVSNCSKEINMEEMNIDLVNQVITFKGVIHPKQYNTNTDRENGHHFIVWSKGGNAKKALITTDVPDETIQDGLQALGAIPGDNLSVETWMERTNEDSPEPDKRTTGTPVEISISWNDSTRPLHELFQNGKEEDFDIRLGGHASLIPVWRSGCVTCLFSCPGGRTSNAVYTIRDQVKNHHEFLADLSKLPSDGTIVTIRMKPILSAAQPSGASD